MDDIKRFTLRLPFDLWKRLTLLSTQAKLEGRDETSTDIVIKALERELDRREKTDWR